MSQHREFKVDRGVQIYFSHPHSPLQRGSNENTNGLLREYFPKRTSLTGYTQRDLDRVARELNKRPRKTLEWMTPLEKSAEERSRPKLLHPPTESASDNQQWH